MLGTPAALDDAQVRRRSHRDDAIAQLEVALARDPRQPEGWRLLGPRLRSRQQWEKSRDAYGRAATLAPDDRTSSSKRRESSALADPRRRFDEKSVGLLRHALELQPQQQRARWFLGIAQRQAGDSAEAAATWAPLLSQVDAKTAEPLREQINNARARGRVIPAGGADGAIAAGGSLQVRVQLDPGFAARARLRGDASIFVIARMPERAADADCRWRSTTCRSCLSPATLDDSDGPMPTRKLSALQDVEVLARLSASGNAMRQPDGHRIAPGARPVAGTAMS
jgi:cytochrome c-type biogenesis protein CcmH